MSQVSVNKIISHERLLSVACKKVPFLTTERMFVYSIVNFEKSLNKMEVAVNRGGNLSFPGEGCEEGGQGPPGDHHRDFESY